MRTCLPTPHSLPRHSQSWRTGQHRFARARPAWRRSWQSRSRPSQTRLRRKRTRRRCWPALQLRWPTRLPPPRMTHQSFRARRPGAPSRPRRSAPEAPRGEQTPPSPLRRNHAQSIGRGRHRSARGCPTPALRPAATNRLGHCRVSTEAGRHQTNWPPTGQVRGHGKSLRGGEPAPPSKTRCHIGRPRFERRAPLACPGT